jgi:hypothetical protein
MPNISKSLDVPATAEEVWAVVTDLNRYPEWLTIHADWPQGVPALEQGNEFVQKIKLMGMPADVKWTVTEVVDGERFSLDGAGPMGAHMKTTWTVSSSNGGAQIAYDAEFGGGAIEGPMGDAVAKQAGQAAEESMEKLKGLVSS